jgi:hypothetical protein
MLDGQSSVEATMRQAGIKTYLRASFPARESLGMLLSLERLLSGEVRPF